MGGTRRSTTRSTRIIWKFRRSCAARRTDSLFGGWVSPGAAGRPLRPVELDHSAARTLVASGMEKSSPDESRAGIAGLAPVSEIHLRQVRNNANRNRAFDSGFARIGNNR